MEFDISRKHTLKNTLMFLNYALRKAFEEKIFIQGFPGWKLFDIARFSWYLVITLVWLTGEDFLDTILLHR